MLVLVSGSVGQPPRVSTFGKERRGDLDKISSGLRIPFFILKVEKLEREEFSKLLNDLRAVAVEDVLMAEHQKFLKKKYNTVYEPIISRIVQIG